MWANPLYARESPCVVWYYTIHPHHHDLVYTPHRVREKDYSEPLTTAMLRVSFTLVSSLLFCLWYTLRHDTSHSIAKNSFYDLNSIFFLIYKLIWKKTICFYKNKIITPSLKTLIFRDLCLCLTFAGPKQAPGILESNVIGIMQSSSRINIENIRCFIAVITFPRYIVLMFTNDFILYTLL